MDLDSILSLAQNISKDVVSKNSAYIDQGAHWPEENIRALQKAGLAGLVVPVAYGGLGHGLKALVKVCEVLGSECPSTAMCFGMHNVGTAVIAAKATEFQKDHYLKEIAAGRHITTLALSEPGTGSHFYYPETLFEEVNEGFKINGKKTFVTNGLQADSYVVSTMAVDHEASPEQFSCSVINANADGLKWGEPWNGFGMRGNSSRSLEINDVVIPANQLLGNEGDQLWYIFNVVAPYFLIAMAGTYLGIAEAALREAVNHLKNRNYSHSGTSLSDIGYLQHKAGMLWSKVERTRQLVYKAAEEGDTGSFDAVTYILAAKAEVAHCATEVVNDAMTLCGGIAYRENSKLSRLLRDARASHVMAPTTDILYTWLGRFILEKPLLED